MAVYTLDRFHPGTADTDLSITREEDALFVPPSYPFALMQAEGSQTAKGEEVEVKQFYGYRFC